MKILFICGSLEPGKNGVGDYTRRLGVELIRLGHQIIIISLYDNHIQNDTDDVQYLDNTPIQTFRIGRQTNNQTRFSEAKQRINVWDPDWISLQFVPFSYNEKGFPWKLSNQLQKIGQKRRWHIMFHELWIGMDTDSSFLHICWGKVQQLIIKKVIKDLDPVCIHTNTSLYKAYLKKLGFNAKLLKLFGNIKNFKRENKPNGNLINIAVFGGIHHSAKIYEFSQWLIKNNKFSYQFHFLGNNGEEQVKWIKILEEHKIAYRIHGWLPENGISTALSSCHWSVSSTPYQLIEKSGAVATMLEHNIYVFCIARTWHPRNLESIKLKFERGIIEWDEKLPLENLRFGVINPDKLSSPKQVAEKFLYSLKQAN